MTRRNQYDIIVIGSGPAGESAAMNSAKKGRRVAVISDRDKVGGNCTHLGTIPSKALRQSVKQVMQFSSNPLLREFATLHRPTFKQIMEHAERVIDDQVYRRAAFYEKNGVDVLHGIASFIDANTIRLGNIPPNNKGPVLQADHFIIATGSRPYRPDNIDFSHPRIFDSDTILQLDLPLRRVTVIGAGVIGCEYASIFAGLGAKVELINPADTLLSFLDWEISDALSYHLRDAGVRSRHNEEYEKLEYFDTHVITHLKSGKRIKSDIVLWANGRTGNTDQLNLDAVGLVPNSRGQLEVNKQYRTAVENIYAAGDVIGWPSLASASYDQGRAASNAIVDPAACREIDRFASGIYTIPEISTLGKTERELTQEKIPYEVGKAFFKNTARGQITGEKVGMLKILFHFETLEILGIHCFGDQASEIVHIGQAIMLQEGKANTMKYFLNTTFNYPTMAEAYRIAALDGLNRVF
ncbi:MAG: NAD(P)(+) transhydrogenase [Gammaproteobacteria bacterium RIFCSPLOWO2_02_FULL_57_10]|nr:MAG: NAD(P)(+) transhydrogenase [Gammaproteobacteria bacterium RIFCSPLOWO2_02_FULL_57_10]